MLFFPPTIKLNDTQPTGEKGATVFAVFNGPAEQGKQLLKPFIDLGPVATQVPWVLSAGCGLMVRTHSFELCAFLGRRRSKSCHSGLSNKASTTGFPLAVTTTKPAPSSR
jgi:hypothetical protein